ncbi:MAG: glycosyltransferase [Acholeplasmataceae bacterium]
MEIYALTVTYNSSEKLEKCIKNILSQSLTLKKVIIVDNASNEVHKNKIDKISKLNNNIEVLFMEENYGGAGGFYYGIKHIIENYDSDWIWLMDDDAYPDENCLRNLVQDVNVNTGACLPLIYGIDREKYQFYHYKIVSNNLYTYSNPINELNINQDIFIIDSGAFVGPLIKTSVISDIGYPDKDLFIYGDDFEFLYRLSRKYDLIVKTNAIINHNDPIINNSIEIRLYNIWKEYYKYRNAVLFVMKYSRSRLDKFVNKFQIKKEIVIISLKTIFEFGTPIYYKVKRIKYISKGYSDGIHGKIGKTIDPQKFINEIKIYAEKYKK